MLVDLHNHTPLCRHCIGLPEEFIKRAIEREIDVFGFSDHAPMEFDRKYRMSIEQSDSYERDILSLKEKYSDKIEILLGYEVDFLENFLRGKILKSKVDYLIGSVHFLKSWGFDNPEFIKEYKNRDIDRVWEDYFLAVENLADSNHFDIVGHFDLIKVFKFFPKRDIKSLAKNSIKAIKRANMSVEVNSAGFRKPIEEQYPSKELLELIYEEDITITFGSDAHSIEQVGLNLDRVISLAKEIGFSKCAVFRGRDRELVNF